MSVRHYIVLLGTAFLVTFLCVPLVRRLSIKHGIVDQPGGRKVHTKAIPRTGGIAMFIGIVAGVCVQLIGEKYFGWGGLFFADGVLRIEIIGAFLGITLMFVVGVIDDIIELSPIIKFGGQVVAAIIVVSCGVRIDYIGSPFGGLAALGIFAYPFTVIYIAGFANVVNLIDGIDGLAGGICAIASTSLLFLAIQLNRLDAAVLAIVLIGACVAFLIFNFNPASIFMGDSGALMLGFMLAVISLLGVVKSTAAIALIIPLIIIGVPIIDTGSAIVRRVRDKRPIQEADKSHIHHQLLKRGFSQKQVVVIIWVWSAVLAVGGFAVSDLPTAFKFIVFSVLVALSVILAHWLGLWGIAYHHPPEELVNSEKDQESKKSIGKN